MDRSIFTGSAEGGRWFSSRVSGEEDRGAMSRCGGLGLVAERIEASTEPWDVAPLLSGTEASPIGHRMGGRWIETLECSTGQYP
jgi:hypothetical protein